MFFGSSEATSTFVRIDAAEETELEFQALDDKAFSVIPGVLEPATTLVIESRCDGGFCSPSGTWSVVDDVDDAPPIFAGEMTVEAQRQRLGTAQSQADVVTINIDSLADDSGPVLVRLVGDEIDDVQASPHFSGELVVRAVLAPDEARTTCMVVSAIDVAGNEASHPDEACANFAGCSQAPASSAAFLAFVALFARVRRRR